jgi:DivIVA domain-containing protein
LVILQLVVDDEVSQADDREKVSPAEQEEELELSLSELLHHVPEDILNVSFPVSVRGYDRRAVDAHLKRVNRLIAEVKAGASPRAAVRQALEQTEQQVRGLLERAREAGEEITASARQEADENSERAKAELAELVVNVSAEADATRAEAETLIANARTEAEDILVRSRLEAENTLARSRAEADEQLQRLQEELAALRDEAETRMRELQADTEAVRKERRQLLNEIRGLASGLIDLADAAAAREPAEPEEEMLEPEAGDQTEPPGDATDESTRAMPAVESREGGGDETRDELPERAASGPGK